MQEFKSFDDFVNLYSLSKTLRFELKPIGKTQENIEKKNLLDADEKRAVSYIEAKKIIDNYHKDFIEKCFDSFSIPLNNSKKGCLEDYYNSYIKNSKDKKDKDALKKNADLLRKSIATAFKENKQFARLFKKELIEQDLPQFIDSEESNEVLEQFNNFTTYFSGFNENRKNMYTDEEKSTAIAYRLINENLPKFIDNLKVFSEIKNKLTSELIQLENSLKSQLSDKSLSDFFTLSGFNITLTQKGIDLYNTIIGGITEKDNNIQGLNQHINLYNQQVKENTKKLPKFKQLYKQILSDRNSLSWLPESFINDKAVLEGIEGCYSELKAKVLEDNKLKSLLQSINKYNLDGIFIKNDQQLTKISQLYFEDWNEITDAIKNKYQKENPPKKNETFEKYSERCEKYFKSFDSFSIAFINQCLKENKSKKNDIESLFIELNKKDNQLDLFTTIEKSYEDVKNLLNTTYPSDKKLAQDDKEIEKIKRLLDNIMSLLHFVKPLLGSGKEPNKDEKFYGDFIAYFDELNKITPLYNKIRNYITQKPYSTKKIKLNFNKPTLLAGWELNKEKENLGIILIKDNQYFLGIMDRDSNKVFEDLPKDCIGSYYEKMDYKYFKDITTMVPKCSTQLKKVKEHFSNSNVDYILDDGDFTKPLTITKEIYDLNNVTYNEKKKFQLDYLKNTGDKKGFDEAVAKWIDFCYKFLESYKSTIIYDYTEIKKQKFTQLDHFYSEVNKLLYKVSFRKVSEKYIDTLIEKGQLYLFHIYNKDFSSFSKGTPNLHTLYWKMLFSPENLQDVVYKLNGDAEIFFREKSFAIEEKKPTHPANHPIKNKNELNNKKESNFNYDIYRNKRYGQNKYLFHVPITINFKADNNIKINDSVKECIKAGGIQHIIGIDRGERHLLYLTVIDLHGNIQEQYSLNEIKNNVEKFNSETKQNEIYEFKTNYHDLLDKREEDRLKARHSWKTIEGIKDLKEGYLSQVIHKISELMIKYKAIVVLEDLNFGFIRGRQKVEKQVYQKFEQMLIDKLNYLVDKKSEPTSFGGLLKAYQLTSKFESFQKLGKQTGFLFYIPAWNTSKIDPVTGFVNLFDTRYKNVETAKEFFKKFDDIRFNKEKNYFEFEFDYNNFTKKAEGTKTKWTVCSHGKRIETFKNPNLNNQWDNKEINITNEIKNFLISYNISLDSNLKDSIINQNEKDFFTGLLKLFKLTIQMRNSRTGTEEDCLISPVADNEGKFFDSDVAPEYLPQNADANGAYNIARKGLWAIQQIKKSNTGDTPKLAISNKEWLQFVQNKEYLK